MIHRNLWFALTMLALAAISQFGCQPTVQPAAPDQARETLRQALDAWKQGETLPAFRRRSAIAVVERKWRPGARLLAYEVVGDGVPSGFDWQCQVQLSLQDTSGRKSHEKAVYTISTTPSRVIVRGES